MNYRVWGSAFFATVLILVSGSIKMIAFNFYDYYFEVSPDIALWATGVLFSLAVSEELRFAGRITRQITRSPLERRLIIEYGVRIPEELDFSPRYIYFFVYALMMWILTVVLSRQAMRMCMPSGDWTVGAHLVNSLGLAFSASTVGVAIRSLSREAQ